MLNKDARERLSARNLDDVPLHVRIGSPYDAPDRQVRRFVRRYGVLHPQTNYGVVYRVVFAPRLTSGETPLTQALRFVYAVSRKFDEAEAKVGVSSLEGAWLLVTDWGIRWHFNVDPFLGFEASAKLPTLEGPRNIAYEEVTQMEPPRTFTREVMIRLTLGGVSGANAGPQEAMTVYSKWAGLTRFTCSYSPQTGSTPSCFRNLSPGTPPLAGR